MAEQKTTRAHRFSRHEDPMGWLLSNTEKTATCWNWTGNVCQWGYGIVSLHRDGRKYTKSNRVSWFLHFGHIEGGLWVLHTCDNRRCVNPAHLYLGTPADNTRDRDSRGRGARMRGDANGAANISDAQALAIYRRRQEGALLQAIAEEFGVSYTCVRKITTGRRYVFGKRLPPIMVRR